LHFAESQVDAAVLEVGMGGRLDSTNVCQPLVSVITSISFDHTQQLGNTLAAIAGEKAGIIKPGVPVVSGVLADEPRQVVADVARRNDCPLAELGRDFTFRYRPPRRLERGPAHGYMDFVCHGERAAAELPDVQLSLTGAHQAANAAVAIATLGELQRAGWNIPETAIRQGLSQVRWPARVEVVARCPTVVLDAAHNVASIEALLRVLDESFAPAPRLLVFATTRGKDAPGMLELLLPAFDEVILTRYWNNPRGITPEELAALAAELAPAPETAHARASGASARLHVVQDAAEAWRLANSLATPDHLICITGSFFIAAEMRATMDELPAD
jgi:dihydrofolate synthase/folylpolyglutamate synthase